MPDERRAQQLCVYADRRGRPDRRARRFVDGDGAGLRDDHRFCLWCQEVVTLRILEKTDQLLEDGDPANGADKPVASSGTRAGFSASANYFALFGVAGQIDAAETGSRRDLARSRRRAAAALRSPLRPGDGVPEPVAVARRVLPIRRAPRRDRALGRQHRPVRDRKRRQRPDVVVAGRRGLVQKEDDSSWLRRALPGRCPVAAVSRAPENIDVFAIGNDGRVHTAWWRAGENWSGIDADANGDGQLDRNGAWDSLGGSSPRAPRSRP